MRLTRMLSRAIVILIVGLLVLPAIAQSDSQLQPATPKFDTSAPSPEPSQKKYSTLKGKIEHSHKLGPAGLNGTAQSGSSSGGYQAHIQSDAIAPTISSGIGIIGVKFLLLGNRPPVISRVFPLTPAASVGLRIDDVIIAVDGVPTTGLRKEEIYDMIIGLPGTPVTISIERRGDFRVYQLTRMDVNDISDPYVRRDYLRSM